jgi:hypothetical protein
MLFNDFTFTNVQLFLFDTKEIQYHKERRFKEL